MRELVFQLFDTLLETHSHLRFDGGQGQSHEAQDAKSVGKLAPPAQVTLQLFALLFQCI
jgi:hypothetical protein